MTTINATNTPQLTLNGQLVIGSTGAIPVAATLTAGSGMTVTNAAGSITLASTGVMAYVNQTSTSVTAVVNTIYGANSSSLITFTLPTTAAAGTIFQIIYIGTGGWTIGYNSGQKIIYGAVSTTTTSGSLSSNAQGDCVTLITTTANTTFTVFNSFGNLTYA